MRHRGRYRRLVRDGYAVNHAPAVSVRELGAEEHNEGVQISGGTQYGPVAGGREAWATVHHAPPAAAPAADLSLCLWIAARPRQAACIQGGEPCENPAES